MSRRTLWIVAGAMLLVCVALGIAVRQLVSGERGMAWLGDILSRYEPRLTLERRSGTLSQARFGRIVWADKDLRVEMHDVAWQLAPDCLYTRSLCFEHLRIGRLDITVAPADATPFRLEPVRLPVALIVDQGEIGSLHVQRESTELARIDAIVLAGEMHGSRIDVQHIAARIDELGALLSGSIELRDQLPMSASGQLTWPGYPPVTGTATGDLARLSISARTDGDYALDGKGWVAALAKPMTLAATISSRKTLVPFPGHSEQLSLDAARLELDGTLQRLATRFDATLNSELLGRNQLHTSGTWTPAREDFDTLTLDGDAGQLSSSGSLALDATGAWQLDATLKDFCVTQLRPELQCKLSGDAHLSGSVAGAEPRLEARATLAGTLNQLPATIIAHVLVDATQRVTLDDVQIHSGTNDLVVRGDIGEQLALDGTLAVGNLAEMLNGAAGTGAGTLHIGGTRATPTVQAQVRLQQAAYGGIGAETLELLGDWQGTSGRAALQLHKATGDGVALDDVSFTLEGTTAAHGFGINASGKGIAFALDCDGGVTAARDWRGSCGTTILDVGERHAGTAWFLDRDFAIGWSAATHEASIAPFCLRNGDASLCNVQRATFAPDRFAGVALRGTALPFGLFADWLPDNLYAAGVFDLTVDAGKKPGGLPRIATHLTARKLSLAPHAAGEEVPMELSDISARLLSADGRTRLDWDCATGEGGHARGVLDIQGRDPQSTLSGSIELDAIDLAPVVRGIPDTHLVSSQLGGRIEISGTAANPQFAGTLSVNGKTFSHDRLPIAIDDFGIDLRFEGPQASIDGRFRSAAGEARLNGTMQWLDEAWSAQLRLASERLRLEPAPGSELTIVPDLDIQLGPDHAAITGEVTVPAASIKVETVPEFAVGVSDDTVFVGTAAPGKTFDYSLDVRIRLGDAVHFTGLGAEARLAGELVVARTPGNPLAGRGEVKILDGHYTAYGKRLDVTEGSLLFRGPLGRPGLRITAVRRIEDEPATVGVRVRGDANEPELKVFSQPAMDENRALHYLLTGHAPAPGSNSSLAVAGAMMQLGAAGTSQFAGGVMGTLGIQDFQVDTRQVEGGNEVQLSGYLSPKIYLRYGVSTFDKVNTLRVRYKLTPKVFVEAISGVQNAVDFLYSFER